MGSCWLIIYAPNPVVTASTNVQNENAALTAQPVSFPVDSCCSNAKQAAGGLALFSPAALSGSLDQLVDSEIGLVPRVVHLQGMRSKAEEEDDLLTYCTGSADSTTGGT